MRLLTNPGSNLPEAARAHYEVALAAQHVLVDHVSHDTRKPVALSEVDAWVQKAREFPKVTGSTSTDLVPVLLALTEQDPELLVLTTSKRLIQTHTSAVAAAATVKARRPGSQITVVDSMTTDLGAALLVVAVGEALRAGKDRRAILAMLELLIARQRAAVHVPHFENLLKSGRASFLKAWLAAVMQVRPLVGLVDGDLRVVGRVKTREDAELVLVERLHEQLPDAGKVWVAVAHSDEPERAARCVEALRRRFDVAFVMQRPLSSSIYLHTGPGAIAAFVLPVEPLPWALPTPSYQP